MDSLVSWGYARRRKHTPSIGNPFSKPWKNKDGVYVIDTGKPMVGDRVRVLECTRFIGYPGNIYKRRGQEGILNHDDGTETCPYLVKFKDGEDWIRAEYLILI